MRGQSKERMQIGTRQEFQLPEVKPLLQEDFSFWFSPSSNKETLVLIHGLDSAKETFLNVLPSLKDKYQVLAYDQRGHGQSVARGENYSSQTMARDLNSLMESLGIEKAHVLGHSMGGRTALHFKKEFPSKAQKLIIEDMEPQQRVDLTEELNENILKEHNLRKQYFENKVFANEGELMKALQMIGYDYPEAASIIERRAKQEENGNYKLLFRPEIQTLYSYHGNYGNYQKELNKDNMLFIQASSESAISKKGEQIIKTNSNLVQIQGSVHNVHGSKEKEYLTEVFSFLNT